MSNKTTLFDGCQGQFYKVTGIGEDCRVARCLSDSWSGASGSWNTPPFQPSPAGLCAACLLYLTSQPKAGGRYGSEGEPVRRKEAKKRREVITSSHWVLKIPPPGSLQGPCTGDKTSAIWSERSRNVLEEYDTSRSLRWQEKQDWEAHTPCFLVAPQRSCVEAGWLLGLPIICTFSYVLQAASHH